ncbi:hypothetical protein P0O24_10820 [Methanotrichaceae archaeon M04Ac]|jgi:hypothetical protein|uniref:Uncharacterized protein n=1 Tax=Candidatus Methanocrinis alkalitolerans TaxID=3033395 RepID=A0ABT5XHU7_9EURY|nr:hypothetical protein [Candidatus Methanocrinis alkalitolerans]MDF0594072.1 hypothetical protein [Candidatus Methanocrinis alkalitolerans]
MSDVELSQADANELIAMPKIRITDEIRYFPGSGGALNVPLVSEDWREDFVLTIRRGRIDLNRGSYQNIGRNTVILLRAELNGPPHRNPDDAEIPCPHIHIYKEGFGTKWAYPFPTDFANPADYWTTLQDFIKYCNIILPPKILRGLE